MDRLTKMRSLCDGWLGSRARYAPEWDDIDKSTFALTLTDDCFTATVKYPDGKVGTVHFLEWKGATRGQLDAQVSNALLTLANMRKQCAELTG
jgi:hypothetical protein